MLHNYNSSAQLVAVNGSLSFDTNNVTTGTNISSDSNLNTFKLNRKGYYLVSFNGVAQATAAATEPITVQLYNNGTAVSGATASGLSEASGDLINLSFDTIIRVKPSCCAVNNQGILTFENTGIAANFTNANVVITQIG